MLKLEDIRRPIAENITHYESFIEETLLSENPFVKSICDYILSHRGKQMRPLLVLLSASLHGEICSRSYLGATIIEMIHTASLIHDDVVDEADLRRGFASVNALWDNRTAVLVGDYIFSKTYYQCMMHDGNDLLSEVTRAIYEVSEGELIQTEQAQTLSLDRATYDEIIRKKTASLISASAVVGARSAGATEAQLEQMRSFGLLLGMAFQIKDDILDYASQQITGKPSCGDLRERKINLPMLYVLEHSTPDERTHLLEMISRVKECPELEEPLRSVVYEQGGIAYAQQQMELLRDEALTHLMSYPPSEVRTALEALAELVLSREK